MRRAARQVDIASVGPIAERHDLEPELREQARRRGGRGAIREVDGDARAGNGPGLRKEAFQVAKVRPQEVALLDAGLWRMAQRTVA